MPHLPQEIAGLMIRDYENPLASLNKALLGHYFLGGGGIGGFPLGCMMQVNLEDLRNALGVNRVIFSEDDSGVQAPKRNA